MSEIASRIAAVVRARRNRLPEIAAEMATWRNADEAVVALDRAVTELRQYPATPAEVADQFGLLRVKDVRPAISTTIEHLQRMEGRFGRATVNIGVSGSARVGKSTLLQAISGLADDQIPTGSGIPVTAVRSRIYHTPGRRRAVLETHDFDSFRSAYLQPRHEELGLPPAPATMAEYREWRYPDAGEFEIEDAHASLLEDLRDMQASLPSYEALLERAGRPVELLGDDFDRLREYVAYPKVEEKRAPDVARKHLAVRDARIECAFPHDDVGELGICDMPGFGDVTVDADKHHVAGLQHEVDVVVLVKRALEGEAYWKTSDVATVRVLDEARGFVSRRRDFVIIALNIGATSDALAESLRDDVLRRVNERKDGLHHRVLEVDAKDRADVSARLLGPVLGHLADRLPVMDGEVLAGTRRRAGVVREDLVGLATEVRAMLKQVRGLTVGAAEDVYGRAREMHKSLAVALHSLLAELRERSVRQDPDYAAAVDTVYDDVLSWVRDGLGSGEAEWCEEAARSMIRDGGAGLFATTELSRIRVEISRRFAQLDLFFHARVEEVWRQVADGLAGELHGVLGGSVAQDALERLMKLAADAAEPCEVMEASLGELLGLRLDYRTQVHPRVRPELDSLNLQVRDPVTGGESFQFAVAPTKDGAEELLQIICELAEQSAFRIRVALLKESVLPGQVLFAAVEHFTDVLIRSGAAEREIRQFARSYRDELWPGVFQGLDGADARVARVARAADALLAVTEELEGYRS